MARTTAYARRHTEPDEPPTDDLTELRALLTQPGRVAEAAAALWKRGVPPEDLVPPLLDALDVFNGPASLRLLTQMRATQALPRLTRLAELDERITGLFYESSCMGEYVTATEAYGLTHLPDGLSHPAAGALGLAAEEFTRGALADTQQLCSAIDGLPLVSPLNYPGEFGALRFESRPTQDPAETRTQGDQSTRVNRSTTMRLPGRRDVRTGHAGMIGPRYVPPDTSTV